MMRKRAEGGDEWKEDRRGEEDNGGREKWRNYVDGGGIRRRGGKERWSRGGRRRSRGKERRSRGGKRRSAEEDNRGG